MQYEFRTLTLKFLALDFREFHSCFVISFQILMHCVESKLTVVHFLINSDKWKNNMDRKTACNSPDFQEALSNIKCSISIFISHFVFSAYLWARGLDCGLLCVEPCFILTTHFSCVSKDSNPTYPAISCIFTWKPTKPQVQGNLETFKNMTCFLFIGGQRPYILVSASQA